MVLPVAVTVARYEYRSTSTSYSSAQKVRVVYGPFHVGVASRLATVTMVTPILYDNSYSLYDSISNIKVIGLMVDLAFKY